MQILRRLHQRAAAESRTVFMCAIRCSGYDGAGSGTVGGPFKLAQGTPIPEEDADVKCLTEARRLTRSMLGK